MLLPQQVIRYTEFRKYRNRPFTFTNLNNAVINLDLLAQVGCTTLTDALYKNPGQFLCKQAQ
jgi:hypothetical protein